MGKPLIKNSLYDRRHLHEYFWYGLIAATGFIIPVWVFFFFLDYNHMWVIFLGSFFFMFVIMNYVFRLSRRKPEYRSSWMMIIAAQFAVFIGIVFSVLFTTILCFIYIPEFMSGDSSNVLKDAPVGLNNQNWSMLALLYVCATIENFGAGGFIAILGPYVFKKNQTKDKTAQLEKEIRVSES